MKSLIAFLSGYALLVAAALAAENPESPNIILFLVDDMGWMDSSAYGSEYYETPNMERLAEQGMRFTDAYAWPLCSPTRASILSGQYPSRHGITTASGHQPPREDTGSRYPEKVSPNKPLIYASSRNYLEPSIVTIAEMLQEGGYRTGHFGKWHIGLTEPHWPEKQGFDVSFHGKPDPGPNSYFSPYGFRNYQSFEDGPEGEYITDRVTEEAIAFMDNSGDQSFFLNLWHYGLHGPWGHKEEYTKRFLEKEDPRGEQGNPIMASMLQSIDESLGRILDYLEAEDLTKNTFFVFYSDNGGNTHSNTAEDRARNPIPPANRRYPMIQNWIHWAGDRPPTSNAPLREGKGKIYEGGVRVPLMVAWPGQIESETLSDSIVGPIDLYPTFLEVAGLEKPDTHLVDGESFLPVLTRHGDLNRDALVTWFPHQRPAVSVRKGDWKLIRRFEPNEEYPDGFELYNLKTDLGETNNLASSTPDKVTELDVLIDAFIEETGALLPIPNPYYKPPVSRPLLGWVPRYGTAELGEGGLLFQPTEARPGFIARAGLKQEGPAQVVVYLQSEAEELAGRVQWREEGEESFDPENLVKWTAADPDTHGWQKVVVDLPVKEKLVHFRFYFPEEVTTRIRSVKLSELGGDSEVFWDFAKTE